MNNCAKKISFYLLVSILCLTANGQEINSKVTAVTIYPRGAKVSRVAEVTIAKGNTQIIFTNLEKGIDPNTLEVKAINSTINLQSIKANSNRGQNQPNSPKWKVLTDSIQIVEEENQWLREQQSIYVEEEKIINKNSQLNTTSNTAKISELKELVAFYRSQLFEIRRKKIALKKDVFQNEGRINKLRAERQKLQNETTTQQILVDLDAPNGVNSRFEFSYFVSNVSWKAVYDLKAQDTKQPMSLHYRAEVRQQTGIDWSGIKVAFSSANPTRRKNQPKLKPIFAAFINGGIPDTMIVFSPETYEEQIQIVSKDAPTLLETEQVTKELLTGFLTELSGFHQIPSNPNPQYLNIQTIDLPTSYQYVCIPKEDPQVYLMARLSNYGQYNLQKGTANLFFENTYIGKTTIDPNTTSDTLEISLGQDPGIVAQRTIRKFNATKTIRNSKKETLSFKIDIRNNKSEPMTIKILDQIPVSTDKAIEVELTEKSGAELCKDSGELEWTITIPAHQSKEIPFSYSMKYPKDKLVGKRDY